MEDVSRELGHEAEKPSMSATGKELWSYEVGQPVMSSPAVSDGLAIFGANDGYVYAFGA